MTLGWRSLKILFLSPPLLWEGDIAITFPAAAALLLAAAAATYISAIPGPIFSSPELCSGGAITIGKPLSSVVRRPSCVC